MLTMHGENWKSALFLMLALMVVHAHGQESLDQCVARTKSCLENEIQGMCLRRDCGGKSCLNGGFCNPRLRFDGTVEYMCTCPMGFEGDRCQQNIDDCIGVTCQNGGTCVDEINGFHCDCAAGYEGTYCATDIDDCAGVTCQNGGTCVDEVNGFNCSCVTGYEGTLCETDINDCIGVTCQNGGTCVDELNGFSCDCVTGYEGTLCETDIDDCIGVTCQNGGTCVDELNGFNCSCVTGYEGTLCETDIDECAVDPCLNDGTCTEGIGQYTCECPELFSGSNCETVMVSVFDGSTTGFGALGSFPGFDFSVGGQIAVADKVTNRVYILDPSLNYISSFSTSRPSDVAYGSDGLLYITYFNDDFVKVFTESGVYQRDIPQSGGVFKGPIAIEADGGLLYIAMYNDERFDVYQEDGTFITQITDGMGFFQPWFMNIHDGNIYASGNAGHINVYNSSYEIIKTYPRNAPPFNTLLGCMDVDSNGTMIVPDRSNSVLLIADSNDVVVGSIGSPGSGLMQLNAPRLASFTPDGNILVADNGNKRLQLFVVL